MKTRPFLLEFSYVPPKTALERRNNGHYLLKSSILAPHAESYAHGPIPVGVNLPSLPLPSVVSLYEKTNREIKRGTWLCHTVASLAKIVKKGCKPYETIQNG